MIIPAWHRARSGISIITVVIAGLASGARPLSAGPRDDTGRPSIRLSVSASSEGTAEASTRIEAGGADIRLRVRIKGPPLGAPSGPPDTPEAGYLPVAALAVSLPYVRFGAVKPRGLAAFVASPGAAGLLLQKGAEAPLALDDSASSGRVGLSLGESCGLFAFLPAPDRPAGGLWLASPGGQAAALLMLDRTPARPGGPLWYDAPYLAVQRAFAALSLTGGGPSWSLAAAAAASVAFPGQDAAAARLEGRASLGTLRIEGSASVASQAWLGPGGKEAPALRLALDLRHGRRGLVLGFGARYVLGADTGEALVGADGNGGADPGTAGGFLSGQLSLSGVAELVSPAGQARVSARLARKAADDSTAIELDTRYRPALAPWLLLSSSWRALDFVSTRFDLAAAAVFGSKLRFTVDSGLRFVPEGRRYKGGFGLEYKREGFGLSASVGLPGWTVADADWAGGLECRLGFSAAAR